MTCHRPGARHCSCAPSAAPDEDLLVLSTADPEAVHALRLLAARAGAEAVAAGGVVQVRGQLARLLAATLAAMPADSPSLGPVAAHTGHTGHTGHGPSVEVGARRPVPLVTLARREELIVALDTAVARARPGTTTAVVFCDVSSGAGRTHAAVLGIAAGRLQGALRRSDTLAHLGNGCFVAVLTDLAVERAEEIASRIAAGVRACFDEPVTAPAGLLVIAPLVGVLVHPGAPAPQLGEVPVPPVTGSDLVAAVERSLARDSDIGI